MFSLGAASFPYQRKTILPGENLSGLLISCDVQSAKFTFLIPSHSAPVADPAAWAERAMSETGKPDNQPIELPERTVLGLSFPSAPTSSYHGYDSGFSPPTKSHDQSDLPSFRGRQCWLLGPLLGKSSLGVFGRVSGYMGHRKASFHQTVNIVKSNKIVNVG